MRWLVRSTDFRTFRDSETIIDADTREQAEAIARDRRMTVTSVEALDGGDNDNVEPWGMTLSLSFLGKPLRKLQLASLMLCGVATIGVLLQAGGMLANRIWIPL
jgi:hypothetical protein